MPGRYNDAPEILPLEAEGRGSLTYWRKEADAALERLKQFRTAWNRNLASYRMQSLDLTPTTDTVVVPRDFANVEQKGSQLFFQVPDVHLTAKQADKAEAVRVFQAVLNHYLSEDEVDALTVMNEVIFDALCPSGLMVSKLGYESFEQGTAPVVVGQRPAAVQPPTAPPLGSVLGLGPTPPPVMEDIVEEVPNIIHERYFWSRLSPGQAIIPRAFKGSNYDRAPFLGYRFDDEWSLVKTRYDLDPDLDQPKASSVGDEDIYLEGEPRQAATRASEERVTGIEIWYRTSLYDPTVAHPEHMRQLVLLDGLDTPLVHRDSPYQDETKTGEIVGMIGFPIHIGALRVVSDSAYPPSECTISRSSVEEASRSRTQMILQRDRSIPMRFADLSRLGGTDGLAKIEKNIFQGVIPLPTFDPNNPPIAAVGLANFPRENFQILDYIDRDNKDVWAMGDNQRGQESAERRTATEQAIVEKSSNARLDKERRQALKYFIRGTRKLGALIQKFGSPEKWVPVVGQDQVARLIEWDTRTIQGKYTYWARPDSAIRLDQAEARTQALKLYELLAKDPNVNRVQLLVEICRQWNLDPQSVVVPQLPEKGPDPAAVTFRFAATDIDPRMPNFPIIMAILEQSGYKIDPAMIAQAQQHAAFQSKVMAMAGGAGDGTTPTPPALGPGNGNGAPLDTEHGGTAPLADHVNKHRAEDENTRPGRKPLVQ
jgi:hypothetical protein